MTLKILTGFGRSLKGPSDGSGKGNLVVFSILSQRCRFSALCLLVFSFTEANVKVTQLGGKQKEAQLMEDEAPDPMLALMAPQFKPKNILHAKINNVR